MKHNNCFAIDLMPLVENKMREFLGEGVASSLACRHLDTGGNKVRARIALDTARILSLSEAAGVAIAAASELLHNAALVHDDLQDGDRVRRGHPALWASCGAGPAVCAGDLMLSAAYAALASIPSPLTGRVIAVMHEAVRETIAGQVEDLAATSELPFDRAIDIAGGKSGPLIALPVRVALILAGVEGDRDAARAATLLAAGYQIADDLSDLEDDRAAGRANIVATLIHSGFSTRTARSNAIAYAREQLAASREAARLIPHKGGVPLEALADRVESRLAENRIMGASHGG